MRYFFRIHDSTTLNRQGGDVGTQYRSAIFYYSEEQKDMAEKIKEEIQKSGKVSGTIVTEISPATTFYVAEDYHQGYLDANPNGTLRILLVTCFPNPLDALSKAETNKRFKSIYCAT